MVKFACLYNHAFLEFFELEASPVEGQLITVVAKTKTPEN